MGRLKEIIRQLRHFFGRRESSKFFFPQIGQVVSPLSHICGTEQVSRLGDLHQNCRLSVSITDWLVTRCWAFTTPQPLLASGPFWFAKQPNFRFEVRGLRKGVGKIQEPAGSKGVGRAELSPRHPTPSCYS